MLVTQVCYYDNKMNKIINNIPEKITNKKNILEYLFSPKYIGSAWVNIYKSNIFIYYMISVDGLTVEFGGSALFSDISFLFISLCIMILSNLI